MRILYFQDDASLLRRVCLSRPAGRMFLTWLTHKLPYASDSQLKVLLPKEWIRKNPLLKQADTLSYEGAGWLRAFSQDPTTDEHIYMLNGHTLISLDETQINRTLGTLRWDAAFIRICPQLQASRETIKLTPGSQVVGFRRLYDDSIEPADVPQSWPELIVFKKNTWLRLFTHNSEFTDFQSLTTQLKDMGLSLMSLNVGGGLTRFDHESVFLDCLEQFEPNGDAARPALSAANNPATGPIYVGKEVTIEPDVTLVGPVILSDGVRVKSGAVVRRSIVGEHVTVDEGCLINNRLRLEQEETVPQDTMPDFSMNAAGMEERPKEYRKWPWFSYQRLGKRVFDICAASVVLILLIPVFPVIMVIVRLASPGPVFYKARRQGLHGKAFDCLKFRTMMHKADSIQERLRVVNQVDGPQFKIDNDPRISGVGKFLRDTCIDELPQFINVLLGQMSIVGPRPSPENENDSSPVWRDARLSVRPGITGLWQICRTRRTSSDFQEWVYFDTEYVRKLSFHRDLWICWKTAQKLIKDFLGQFG